MLVKTLLQKPFPHPPELEKIAKVLIKQGDEIRLVGGCVRDFLINSNGELGDIDIACKYEPQQTTKLLIEAGIKVIPTGIEHGTVTAVINGKTFEITTLRKDIVCDGRHAKVEFGTDYRNDAQRRDFTINAMYIDFDNNLYDYFDGHKDLKNKTIRFIGDPEQRIQEDYLRILRFFRFYCKYGESGVIDQESLAACIKYKNDIRELSGERIAKEMLSIFKQPYPLKTLEMMHDNEILQEAMEINNAIKLDFSHLKRLLQIEAEWNLEINLSLRIVALLAKEGIVKTTALRLKLSNRMRDYLLALVNYDFGISMDSNIKDMKELLLDYPKHLLIDRIILSIAFDNSLIINNETEHKFQETTIFIENYTIPAMPLKGDDLLKEGFHKGREIGNIIKSAREYWIDSDYKATKQELLEFVNSNLR